ncbi:MAG: hypothetical protein ACRD4B_02105 [Acidobacteriota bacterium]
MGDQMKPVTYFAVLLIQFASTATLADPNLMEVDRCEVYAEAKTCILAWNYSASPSMRFDVERLSPVNGKWQVVERHDSMLLTGSTQVPGGYLYRTLGCNGSAPDFNDKCVSSSVVWAPAYLPIDEIPESVADSIGRTMLVDKSGDLSDQIEQYNVYTLVSLLTRDDVDLKNLPPMKEVTENDVWPDGKLSLAQSMQRAFYQNYSGLQQIAIHNAERGDTR